MINHFVLSECKWNECLHTFQYFYQLWLIRISLEYKCWCGIQFAWWISILAYFIWYHLLQYVLYLLHIGVYIQFSMIIWLGDMWPLVYIYPWSVLTCSCEEWSHSSNWHTSEQVTCCRNDKLLLSRFNNCLLLYTHGKITILKPWPILS